ncbi:pseudouridine-5'-phosphate glycosidase [Streptomyces sp. TR06-5]|uniref:pseudouridine-5'-phosphate glycosidase n=1 Tax=unclassified Streptomyces TaxID=2593676 RepID=UPI0039A2F798
MTLLMADEVRDAMEHGRPVVALESALLAHGLPRPGNLETALELEDLVREGGAVPATVAVLDGRVRVGLDKAELERVATDEKLRKLGHRDLAPALADGACGATTVSATGFVASRTGIKVLATGGLGGVHRGWSQSQDESADLRMLASTRITVVCSGVKSVLDVPATLQRLETLGVTVIGYGTDTFPGFLMTSSGRPVGWTAHDPRTVVSAMRAQETLGGPCSAMVVAHPVPEDRQLAPDVHDRVLADALAACERAGVTGPEVTPHLLDHLMRHTGGAALEANLAALRGNARLASRIAALWTATAHT